MYLLSGLKFILLINGLFDESKEHLPLFPAWLFLTSGSRSHSASEHSDAKLLWVVELESFRELSAEEPDTLWGPPAACWPACLLGGGGGR